MPRSKILPTTPTRPRPAAKPAPAATPLLALLAATALVLAAAGCTSEKRDQGNTSQSQTSAVVKPTAKPLKVEIRAAAAGPERGFNPKVAAQKASPNMQRFLHRYLSVAFLDPGQQRSGWRDLLVLFDGSVQAAAKRDLGSLSLGSDAAQIKSVQPDSAKASVLFLWRGGRPAAATVKLTFKGSAEAEKGNGAVRLRSVLQLLSTPAGWRIAGYQSRTGEAA